MPHISKKQLSEKTERALKNKLVDMLRIIGKDRKVTYSLNELLTFTEGVMLAKRLGMIYLVHKGNSTLDICDTLNVSPSTVARIEKIQDRGGYQNIEKVFHKLEPSLIEVIEILLSSVPSKVGKDRWNFLNKDD